MKDDDVNNITKLMSTSDHFNSCECNCESYRRGFCSINKLIADKTHDELIDIVKTSRSILMAVMTNGDGLEHVIDQAEEICLAAIEQSVGAFCRVKEQTPELCMTAVKKCGYNLEYVVNQTPELCLAAVTRHGCALEYVKEQTPELCLVAVNNSPLSLRFVREQTPEICVASLRRFPESIRFVTEKDALLLHLIKTYP